MKLLTDLKQGDVIYEATHHQVKHYKYLCVHPTGQGKYHILIDACEEPLRIYGEKLQLILNQNLKTYQEAKLEVANRLEQSAKRLRSEQKSIE